jgi:hypothetical protein
MFNIVHVKVDKNIIFLLKTIIIYYKLYMFNIKYTNSNINLLF